MQEGCILYWTQKDTRNGGTDGHLIVWDDGRGEARPWVHIGMRDGRTVCIGSALLLEEAAHAQDAVHQGVCAAAQHLVLLQPVRAPAQEAPVQIAHKQHCLRMPCALLNCSPNLEKVMLQKKWILQYRHPVSNQPTDHSQYRLSTQTTASIGCQHSPQTTASIGTLSVIRPQAIQ